MISLTRSESDFLHHFNHEVYLLEKGPAGLWLREHDIFPTTIQPFQYADQMSNPRYLDRITEDPLPPFRPAWASREEFNIRAAETVDAYPELKQLGSALPGFEPTLASAPDRLLA